MTSDGSHPPDDTRDVALDEYRREARAWLDEHMPRRDGPDEDHDIDHYTPEVMAANRALQRRLYEGGYAGITWPKEYGGQGLSRAYESAFWDEAAAFVMPDFGALSITTFYVCVPTMLTSASPEFLRRFVPRVLAGEQLVCQILLGAVVGLGSRRCPDERHPRRGALGPQRAEDLEHVRTSGRRGHVPGPDRLERDQAPGPDLVPGAVRRSGSDDTAHQADQRSGRVLRGILRRCDRPRCGPSVRGQRGVGPDADDVRLRARRRATPGRLAGRGSGSVGTRPGGGGPAGRASRRPHRPTEPRPGTHHGLRREGAGRSDRPDGPARSAHPGRCLLRQAVPGHVQPAARPPGGGDRRRRGHDMGSRRPRTRPSPRSPTCGDGVPPSPEAPTRPNGT